jgi:hypothetical protein
MPMANPNYVCTICSQTFTRKWRGTVHNNNTHGGLAKVVRLIDYMIGRSNGEYVSSDPSLYRRRKRWWDSIEHERPFLDKKLGQEGYFHSSKFGATPARSQQQYYASDSKPVQDPQQQYYASDSKPVQDPQQQFNEGIIKAAELKKLLIKFLPPGKVRETLFNIGNRCVVAGNSHPLDQALEEAIKNAKLKEAVDYLNTY